MPDQAVTGDRDLARAAELARSIEHHARVVVRTSELGALRARGMDAEAYALLCDTRTAGLLPDTCRCMAALVRALSRALEGAEAVTLDPGGSPRWHQGIVDAEQAVAGFMAWDRLDESRLQGCALALTAWAAGCAARLMGPAAPAFFDLMPRIPGVVELYGAELAPVIGGEA